MTCGHMATCFMRRCAELPPLHLQVNNVGCMVRPSSYSSLLSGHAVAPSYLFFGSRNRQKDYYYGAFWEQCQHSGVLAQEDGLIPAFSRDQPKKVYVHHRIRERAAALWAALQQVQLTL